MARRSCRCCVHNAREAPAGLDRAGALAHRSSPRRSSCASRADASARPSTAPRRSVNTYPVLATEADDAVLGHRATCSPTTRRSRPRAAAACSTRPRSRRRCCSTSRCLSDAERAEIERADPAVREMIERAAAATPEDIIALHGRVELRDPVTLEPPAEPPNLPDPAAGQPEAIVDGVRFARGLKVVIRRVRTPTSRRGCSTVAPRRSSGSSPITTGRRTWG